MNHHSPTLRIPEGPQIAALLADVMPQADGLSRIDFEAPAVIRSNRSAPRPASLARLTFGDLVSQTNWTNDPSYHAAAEVAAPSRGSGPRKSPRTLTVGGYFALVNWTNDPNAVREWAAEETTGPRLAETMSVAQVMARFIWE